MDTGSLVFKLKPPGPARLCHWHWQGSNCVKYYSSHGGTSTGMIRVIARHTVSYLNLCLFLLFVRQCTQATSSSASASASDSFILEIRVIQAIWLLSALAVCRGAEQPDFFTVIIVTVLLLATGKCGKSSLPSTVIRVIGVQPEVATTTTTRIFVRVLSFGILVVLILLLGYQARVSCASSATKRSSQRADLHDVRGTHTWRRLRRSQQRIRLMVSAEHGALHDLLDGEKSSCCSTRAKRRLQQ
jgi:hypothetical protein